MNTLKEKITEILEKNSKYTNEEKEFLINELMKLFMASITSSQSKFREGSD
jgi:hypothetical protein